MNPQMHGTMKAAFAAACTTALMVSSVGCASETPAPPAPVTEPAEVQTKAADRETDQEVDGLDSEKTVIPTRWVRRIKIDQLQASIPRVAGNDAMGVPIKWRISGNDALDDAQFGVVLGRPDYVNSTEENPASSSLYLKFMRDMARDVCTQMVEADTKRPDGQERTLWRYAPISGELTDSQITENLQYLVLRFLGMKLDAQHQVLTDFRKVYDAGVSSTGLPLSSSKARAEGWRGVCIGLFESPLFHID